MNRISSMMSLSQTFNPNYLFMVGRLDVSANYYYSSLTKELKKSGVSTV